MSAEIDYTLRGLKPDDLEKVVDIDARITARSRRMFFEKRLEAALSDEKGFISVAVEGTDGTFAGFAIARLQSGEFGVEGGVAVVDVIGVDPARHNLGIGRMLLDGIADYARKRGIGEIRTQVDWADHDLLSFFSSAGFSLAHDRVFERPTTRTL